MNILGINVKKSPEDSFFDNHIYPYFIFYNALDQNISRISRQCVRKLP